MTLDLKELLANVKPNIITPHLKELTNVKNEKKPKTLAQIMVKSFHDSLENPVAKQIYHKGDVHTIRYFDITPLMRGAWAEMSLILLNLSFAEQCDIIDSLYPDDVKLTAKAFAINFTKDVGEQQVVPVQDEDLVNKLDTTNAGIAMVLAILANMGGNFSVHPDVLAKFVSTMETVSSEARERDRYAKASEMSDKVNKYRDKGVTR